MSAELADLSGSKGLGSALGRLLYCLMMSLILEVGSGRGLMAGFGDGFSFWVSASLAGGLRRRFTVEERRNHIPE